MQYEIDIACFLWLCEKSRMNLQIRFSDVFILHITIYLQYCHRKIVL